MKVLYYDCFSGISGDMNLGAMLDLGVDPSYLLSQLQKLNLPERYRMEVRKETRKGITGTRLEFIILDGADHEHVHKHEHEHEHGHEHGHGHGHEHGHGHGHGHRHKHGHGHAHSHVNEHGNRQDHDYNHVNIHETNHEINHDINHEHQKTHENINERCDSKQHAKDYENKTANLDQARYMRYDHDHAHCHDHVHGHGHNHVHDHVHDQDQGNAHVHDNGHGHSHTHHSHQESRNLSSIRNLISSSDLSPGIKKRSLKMFELLAQAEAKVHGIDKEEVHFHEVGAVDAILDIVGAAICLEYLQVDKIISSSVELGGGFVTCAHGTIPVPAPAVAEILQGIPVKMGKVRYETTTPTGAVILAANVDSFTDRQELIIEKTGYGVGQRDLDIPNVLRVYLGSVLQPESAKSPKAEHEAEAGGENYLLETNLDDMNPEFYDYVEERLYGAGAADVFKTPIMMKKGRPAVQLSVLVSSQKLSAVEEILYRETSTIGIRKYPVEKSMLARESKMLETSWGPVSVKYSSFNGEIIKAKPEFEDCKKIAREKNISLHELYREINYLLHKILSKKN